MTAHYRRIVPDGPAQPVECGQTRPILGAPTPYSVTSDFEQVTCPDCRAIARLADAAAIACGCRHGYVHRCTARARHQYGGET